MCGGAWIARRRYLTGRRITKADHFFSLDDLRLQREMDLPAFNPGDAPQRLRPGGFEVTMERNLRFRACASRSRGANLRLMNSRGGARDY
jgi:hypothetical protein